MLPDRTDRVIINLKVMGYVKPGERITMRNNSFSIQQAGWGQCLQRWQYGETRWASLANIQNVVEDALRIIGTYVTMFKVQMNEVEPNIQASQYPLPTPESCANYINDMGREIQNAMVGLENLKITYEFDPLMLSHIDLIIQKMRDDTSNARRVLTANVYKLKSKEHDSTHSARSLLHQENSQHLHEQPQEPSLPPTPLLALPNLQQEEVRSLELMVHSSHTPHSPPPIQVLPRAASPPQTPVPQTLVQDMHTQLSGFHTPSASPLLSPQISPSLPLSGISVKKKNMDRDPYRGSAAGH